MDPQRPNTPTTEPTPDSPAPTQTSPVTPDPDQPVSAPTPETQPKSGNSKKLLAAIIGVVVIIAGLIFLFLSPWSPFVAAAPAGPKITVGGKNNYQYACSVLDKSLAAKELDIKEDINKENVNETFAYDPANTSDKTIDLLKKADAESATSSCTLKLDRIQEGAGDRRTTSFINVTLSLEQFASEDAAKETYNDEKDLVSDTQALPSFSTSFYTKPQSSGTSQTLLVQPRILHKNMIMTFSTPVEKQDASGEKTAKHISTIIKDVVARLNNRQGEKLKNFSDVNKIGDSPFIDSCTTVNYAKVAAAMGNNTQLNSLSVAGNQAYAPDNNGGTLPNRLASNCVMTFRTQYETDQAKNYKPGTQDDDLTFTQQYPHFMSVQAMVTAKPEDAKKMLAASRKQAEAYGQQTGSKPAIEDIKVGDGGLKVTLDQNLSVSEGADDTEAGDGSKAALYYMTDGPRFYVFGTTYVKQTAPIKTQIRDLGPEQVKQIYKEMTMASKRAK